MGGVKKKPLAAMEKQQDTQTAGGEDLKQKKDKESKNAPQQQKKLSFLVPKMSDQEMVKVLSGQRAVTIYNASRALAVNASVASSILSSLEEKGMLVRAGGFSGHYVWTVAS